MSGSVQAEQASIRLYQPLRLPARTHRVRKADRLHCTTCSTVCFAHASCFYSFFLVVVQAGLYSQRRDVIRNWHGADFTDSCFRIFRLSKAGRLLPELFNFLTNKVWETAAATRKNTSLGDCGARQ